MVIIVISLLMENKSDNKNVNFPTLFYLGSVSNKFGAIDLREISLERNGYNFSVDYNAIHKSEILNIHKYLIVKVVLSPSEKNCVIYFIENPLKMMKNVFSFILKALFVLKIFKFLS